MARLFAKRYGVVALGVAVLLLVSVLAFAPDPIDENAPFSDEELAVLAAGGEVERGSAAGDADEVSTGIEVITYPTGATVYVEFEPVGTTPMDPMAMDAGAYFVTVNKPGFTQLDTLVFVERRRVSSLYVVLQPEDVLAGAAAGGVREAVRSERAASPSAQAPARAERETSAARTPARTPSPQRTEPERPRARTASAQSAPPSSPPPRVGTLRIESEPSGARVTLDGRAVGTTPLTVRDVQPGDRQIALSKEGYSSSSGRVAVEAGEQATFQATLEQPLGEVVVLVRPWGSIYVNGELRRSDTDVQYSAQLPAGTHTIRVTHPGLGSEERTVEVRPGSAQRVTIDLN